MSDLVSYANIIKDRQNFRRSGTIHGDDFNIYDTPAHKYFKILFYFGSKPEFDSNGSSGLLAPTWEIFKPISVNDVLGINSENASSDEKQIAQDLVNQHNSKNNYYEYNSAWAFLKLNNEEERAEKLEQFVTLLSDISANSPWYFSTLGGINEAINRKSVEDGKMDVSEDRKLTINCLPDAFDNRIGTLLELYRDVTWSWVQKKEIIPANLRKFDMAVYIFETPELNWHDYDSDADYGFKPSYKMIEFHDCEFNYNSSKSAWNDIDNKVGISPTYSIEISYKDCYEISYNDIMMRTIGDVILTDISYNESNIISTPQSDDAKQQNQVKLRTNPHDRGILGNALGQVVGSVVSGVKDKVKDVLLGNIYGLSLTNVKDFGRDVINGNIIPIIQKTSSAVKQMNSKRGQSAKDFIDKNIYKTKQQSQPKKQLGNIFNPSTIANN